MQPGPLTLSMETLIAASPLLGHKLEDRSRIRDGQDRSLLDEIQAASTAPLRGPTQVPLFLVAPLDVLVVEAHGRKQFHITETNGTGIGGLTNLALDAVGVVLGGLTQMAQELPDS